MIGGIVMFGDRRRGGRRDRRRDVMIDIRTDKVRDRWGDCKEVEGEIGGNK